MTRLELSEIYMEFGLLFSPQNKKVENANFMLFTIFFYKHLYPNTMPKRNQAGAKKILVFFGQNQVEQGSSDTFLGY